MTTIVYDKPVRDLVSALSATGHVTHTPYRKTSVTLHHNGGRLSHQGVLNVWKSRPASAHFDVDNAGAVAQYVKINEYAWAVGNTTGNKTSISIEMANIEIGPTWTVSPTTWRSTARLAGWIFAKVIGVRPSSSNFFTHKHWSSTACAGPCIDKVWPLIMVEAQSYYDSFKGIKLPPRVKPGTLPITGVLDDRTTGRLCQWVGAPISKDPTRAMWRALQHKVGGVPASNNGMPNATMWRALQRLVGAKAIDGVVGPDTIRHLQIYLNSLL